MKKILLAFVLCFSPSLWADVYFGPASSSGTFRGEITAIEPGRESITVRSAENTVKMFHVPANRIGRYQTGQVVTVSYEEAYAWPLRTRSIR
ncbi:MAG: hypothetical protein SNJ84_00050 [Verrucomicrobiia bacterium]